VYELWNRCASARQVVAELAAEGQLLPRRTVGQRRIRWEPADFGAVHDFLTNPTFAGTFAFGRRREVKTVTPDGTVKTSTVKFAFGEWAVCVPDHRPGEYRHGAVPLSTRRARFVRRVGFGGATHVEGVEIELLEAPAVLAGRPRPVVRVVASVIEIPAGAASRPH
jgi:hypothetical protein